ncbi:alpha/beta hydrolase [Alisedimentitalea sp. MJ-SS2]|uniref:alpha/beta fold hydrolase n=1 Tax=Aliisedimentitalea sp. MJ-SS2 TaxID=3049795 RepID=UPI002913121E|nr:alpha/beta hydrolase [Alisedimentitalea sp. MJ-SS2]MDU8926324.1 alpha/beta hydrolase [Alisedimentitalea sp. MJ-SS2]
MQSHFITLAGQRFHYLTWGDPSLPPLLMLHGFPEYSAAFADLAPLLSDHFHVIAPDQRGYGQSWAPPEVVDYTAGKLIGDMAALMAALDLGPCCVLGHDWGAAVAYGLAMTQPDLVSRLIIVNGVHPAPFQRELAAGSAQSEASQYIEFLRRPDAEDILSANGFERLMSLFSAKMSLDWMTPDIRAAYLHEWSRPGRLRGMINWYRASPLAVARPGEPIDPPLEFPPSRFTVPQPHLLIWADGDTALLPETTHGLEAYTPQLTRVTIAEADHWVCHQKPGAVAQAILAWFGKRDHEK